ncbi:MAG: N-acetyltransferase [Halieaceae bacterium]|jgi:predicted N-acyltransferase|nr:N-acetyltransferase [Halieaceae bacterium]MBT4854387.1 N-acetyltransferase [Halieaceae bacterium]
MQLDIYRSIRDISASDWDHWFGGDYPFLRHDFLLGLEDTGCTTEDSGWAPHHMVLRDGSKVVGAAPGFLKEHSYGEYVFDWAWADAWQRSGLSYYPKLVSAAPFTPASGPKIWFSPEVDGAKQKFCHAVQAFCLKHGLSSWHILFSTSDLSDADDQLNLVERATCQFHWINRGYESFDDFLQLFSSRKRKNLRKERDHVAAQGLSLVTRVGSDILPEDWSFFHYCYQTTYAKRSGHGGYLSREFFTELCPKLGSAPVMVLASLNEQPVAAALFFQSSDTLYGRYWGCLREYDGLHFEACYYQGIEYCISNGIQRLDPGAQGEHKIQRGFEPTLTRSHHWVAEPGFQPAIKDFCARDIEQVKAYKVDATQLLPFKEGALKDARSL